MTEPLSISDLRAELGLTLAELGEKVGLSKSQMHDAERTGRASLRVAIELESLSDGRIDAARLNDDVRKARVVCVLHSASSNQTGAQDRG